GGKSSLLCPQTSEKRHSGAKHAFYAPNRQKLAGMAHSRPIHLPTPGKTAEKPVFLWQKRLIWEGTSDQVGRDENGKGWPVNAGHDGNRIKSAIT
ncbi:MAG: hypothetical protein K6D54_05625, partial [Bacteroidales bacterium]|nr:hypothetical protein [Bacteroidales bacterium]